MACWQENAAGPGRAGRSVGRLPKPAAADNPLPPRHPQRRQTRRFLGPRRNKHKKKAVITRKTFLLASKTSPTVLFKIDLLLKAKNLKNFYFFS